MIDLVVMRASMVYIETPVVSQGNMGKASDQVTEPWARKPSMSKR